MESEAALEATYRLLNNPAVSFERLLAAHAEKTRERAESAGAVLAIHDTTTCQSRHAAPGEIGYLSTKKAGFFLHSCLVVDAATWRRPLGVVHAETIHREKPTKGRKKFRGNDSAKWTDKESLRWQRGIQSAATRLAGCDRVIHVADREADSYVLLDAVVATGQDLVVRVAHDRRAASPTLEPVKLKSLSRAVPGVLEREVPLSKRKSQRAPSRRKAHPPRVARTASLRMSATSITLKRPDYLSEPVANELCINVVRVWEPEPPEGEEAIEWFLLTSLPISTSPEIAEVVDIYRSRWLIEEFHQALKTGCIYEQREFEGRDALTTLLAMSLPIACELLWIRSRARTEPNAPATNILSPLQIKLLRHFGSRPLTKNPTVVEALWALAGLGGHQKNNGYPGWKILQRAYSDLLRYEAGWRAASEM
jgi:hypothetical protein